MTHIKRIKRATPDPALVKLADSLLANYKKSEDLIGENGLLKHLTKMLVERALGVEMTDHLGHSKSGEVTNDTSTTRNSHSAKTLKGDFGALPLDIPRDGQGSFELQIVNATPFTQNPAHPRSFAGADPIRYATADGQTNTYETVICLAAVPGFLGSVTSSTPSLYFALAVP